MFETLNKILEGKKNLEVKASEPINDKWLKDSPPHLTKQYQGTPSQLLAAKVWLISGAQMSMKTSIKIAGHFEYLFFIKTCTVFSLHNMLIFSICSVAFAD